MIACFANDPLGALDQGAVAPSAIAASEDAAVARLGTGGFVVPYVGDRAGLPTDGSPR